jgi:hypothetical protein
VLNRKENRINVIAIVKTNGNEPACCCAGENGIPSHGKVPKMQSKPKRMAKKVTQVAPLQEWTTWMIFFVVADTRKSLDEGDNGSVGGKQSGKVSSGRVLRFLPILEFRR